MFYPPDRTTIGFTLVHPTKAEVKKVFWWSAGGGNGAVNYYNANHQAEDSLETLGFGKKITPRISRSKTTETTRLWGELRGALPAGSDPFFEGDGSTVGERGKPEDRAGHGHRQHNS
jgi:hypothetical protein